jgi:hypothetical protein
MKHTIEPVVEAYPFFRKAVAIYERLPVVRVFILAEVGSVVGQTLGVVATDVQNGALEGVDRVGLDCFRNLTVELLVELRVVRRTIVLHLNEFRLARFGGRTGTGTCRWCRRGFRNRCSRTGSIDVADHHPEEGNGKNDNQHDGEDQGDNPCCSATFLYYRSAHYMTSLGRMGVGARVSRRRCGCCSFFFLLGIGDRDDRVGQKGEEEHGKRYEDEPSPSTRVISLPGSGPAHPRGVEHEHRQEEAEESSDQDREAVLVASPLDAEASLEFGSLHGSHRVWDLGGLFPVVAKCLERLGCRGSTFVHHRHADVLLDSSDLVLVVRQAVEAGFDCCTGSLEVTFVARDAGIVGVLGFGELLLVFRVGRETATNRREVRVRLRGNRGVQWNRVRGVCHFICSDSPHG